MQSYIWDIPTVGTASYSFYSVLKLVTDLHGDQAIKGSQISLIENTAWWICSEKIDQPEVPVYRSICKLHQTEKITLL